jgi:hypothetical protein
MIYKTNDLATTVHIIKTALDKTEALSSERVPASQELATHGNCAMDMGVRGGLGPPGGGVTGARQAAFAAIRNPLRGWWRPVGPEPGGRLPPLEYASLFLC